MKNSIILQLLNKLIIFSPIIISVFYCPIAIAQNHSRAVKFTLDSTNYVIWSSSNNDWDKDLFRTSYVYNDEGNVIELKSIGWSSIDNKWVHYNKEEFIYNTNGNNTHHIYFSWVVNTGWSETYKQENSFDSNGKLIESKDFTKDQGSGQWNKQWKTTNSYNNSNQLVSSLITKWNNTDNQWNYWEKNDNQFDTKLNIYKSIKYTWNFTSNQWDSSVVTNNNHDATNNLISSEILSKDPNNGIWNLDLKDNFVYNQNGFLVDFTRFDYVFSIKSRKLIYSYDSNMNTSQITAHLWDTATSVWVNSKKTGFNYDNNYSKNELIFPEFYEENNLMNHMLINQVTSNWDKNNLTWNKNEKYSFSYSKQISTSINNPVPSFFNVYPNPCQDLLFINYNSADIINIKIFNINGIELYSSPINNNAPINLSLLPKGIYIYIVKTPTKSFNGKLIIE